MRGAKACRRRCSILTARGTVGDRVLGLNTGADDYLAKPFDLDELEARVRALARRGATARGANGAAEFGGLSVDEDSGAVCLQGQPMELTTRESALLRALLARPGQAVAKERLTELVFPGEADVQCRGHRGRGVPAAQASFRPRPVQLVTLARPGLPAEGTPHEPEAGTVTAPAPAGRHPSAGAAVHPGQQPSSLYRQALKAADTAYDRTLLASAKSIGELLEVASVNGKAKLHSTVPYAAHWRPSRPTTAAACTTA